MLYIIGIGLGNERDITINSKATLKKCDTIYLENYTSFIGFEVKKLEKLIRKKVVLVDRSFVEVENEIIAKAKNQDAAFLVKGDVFSATTHTSLFLRCKQENINCKIIHNASIITGVGDTGLSLYKFGKIVSIPFDNDLIDSPYEIFLANNGMHTLFLLDLRPTENRYMDFKVAFNYLLKKSSDKKDRLVNLETFAVVCAAIGTEKAVIKYGKISELMKLEINVYPQCVILPGDLHFMEEEMLNCFKI